MTCRMTLMMMCAMVALVAAPTWAEKQWDVGTVISGQLQEKAIKLPVSLVGPSTDTMACENPDDADHSIDPEQSEGQEEVDGDAIAGWGETKCWWWCEGGEVTQGTWTTTWTAPAESGWYRLECAVEDLPKAIPPSETGCRDDARHYAGTGYPDGAGESGVSALGAGLMGAGGPPQPAAAVGATLTLRDSNWTQGDPQYVFPEYAGSGTRLGLGTPDDNFGTRPEACVKRVEIVAQIDPPLVGEAFYWRQDVEYYIEAFDIMTGTIQLIDNSGGYTNDDPLPSSVQAVSDGNGRIFMWDNPGLTTPDWEKENRYWMWEHMRQFFRNAVLFGGKPITGTPANHWGLYWGHEVKVSAGTEPDTYWRMLDIHN